MAYSAGLTLAITLLLIIPIAKGNQANCAYDRDSGSWSQCYRSANLRRRILTLQAGSDSSCSPTKIVEEPCIACKYERGPWSTCDPATNRETRILTLFQGADGCEQTRTRTRNCRKKRGVGCRYSKGEWTACVNGKKSRTLTRKTRSPDTCEPTKVITKQCQGAAGCKYRKSKGPCNPTTNVRTVTLTLKKGNKKNCEERKIVTRMCKKKIKPAKCKYSNNAWSECDTRTNTMSQTLTVIPGSPPVCIPAKVITKKCKKVCKFRKGSWSDCDLPTMLMSRTDTLIAGSSEKCAQTRTISKKCKKRKNKNKKNKRKKNKKNKKKMKRLTAPRDLTVVPAEDNPLFVRVYWQPPRQINGQINGYLIFFTDGEINNPRDWVVETVLGDRLSANIKNLTPNTVYFFKVQAKTDGGHGFISDIVSYKTPQLLN